MTLAILLVACSSVYIEPKEGSIAKVRFAQSNFGHPANLTIDVSNISCEDLSSGKGTRISRHNLSNTIAVPSGKPMYVSIYRSAFAGFRVIGGEGLFFPENDTVFFTPKEGKFYRVTLVRFLEKTKNSRYSAIGVVESDEIRERWPGDVVKGPGGESRVIQVTRCGQDKPSYDLNNINSHFIFMSQ